MLQNSLCRGSQTISTPKVSAARLPFCRPLLPHIRPQNPATQATRHPACNRPARHRAPPHTGYVPNERDGHAVFLECERSAHPRQSMPKTTRATQTPDVKVEHHRQYAATADEDNHGNANKCSPGTLNETAGRNVRVPRQGIAQSTAQPFVCATAVPPSPSPVHRFALP